MTEMKKKHIFICLAFLDFLTGSGDVLMWTVDENTKVDGGGIQQFLDPYPSTDDSWPAARVKLVSSDGSSSTILKIWGEDEFGNKEEWDGDWGMEIADWEGGWGTGVPTGNQSETGFNTIDRIQDIIHGDVLDVPPEVLEAMFIMELGYNEWNEGANDYVWKTLAESAPELYKDLVRNHMYATGDVAPNGMLPWSPNFYTRTTPEPSSALLCIIGFGVLMLRRKTSKWENG